MARILKTTKTPDKSSGLGARLAVGFLCAGFAVGTYLILALLLTAQSPRAMAEPLLLVRFSFGKIGVLTAMLGFFAGFLLGSERMAEIFSFCWGTHQWWKHERNQRTAGVVALLVVVGVILYKTFS